MQETKAVCYPIFEQGSIYSLKITIHRDFLIENAFYFPAIRVWRDLCQYIPHACNKLCDEWEPLVQRISGGKFKGSQS